MQECRYGIVVCTGVDKCGVKEEEVISHVREDQRSDFRIRIESSTQLWQKINLLSSKLK